MDAAPLLEQQKSPRPDGRRWLSKRQAAEYAGLSVRGLERLLLRRLLTAYRPTPRRVLIDRHELDAAILGSAQPA